MLCKNFFFLVCEHVNHITYLRKRKERSRNPSYRSDAAKFEKDRFVPLPSGAGKRKGQSHNPSPSADGQISKYLFIWNFKLV